MRRELPRESHNELRNPLLCLTGRINAAEKSAALFVLLMISNISLVLAEEKPTLDYQHGYAFLSTPSYPADFKHFNYVNPMAPKGGRLRIPLQGTWDNFNNILEGSKGRIAGGLNFWLRDQLLLLDTLMTPGLDEPATYYGVLAEGVAIADDRRWVAFKLRKEARWHDGEPITLDDVEFSLAAFQEQASPVIRTSFAGFVFEKINDQEFRFLVPQHLRSDPSIIFTLGGMAILPKHYWQSRDLTKTTVEAPLGSGPYKIGEFSVGRWIEYNRVENYWGAHLPVRRGMFNFNQIKYDYFRDDQIRTEALKGNVVDIRDEAVPRTWESSYDTPAFKAGLLKKTRHRLLKPAGLWWPIFWNLDQPRFQDIRVRKALWLMQDLVWGAERSYNFFDHGLSFFHDSELAATGLPNARELELLEPYRDQIPASVFTDEYGLQPNSKNGWSRDNMLQAARLLKDAGWVIENDQLVHHKTREPFHIRFVAVSPALAAAFVPITNRLKRLGISSSIKAPEVSNWLFRMQSGDFDAGAIWFLPTYTPTLTIANAFHSREADKPYSSNWSGLKDPVIDSLIAEIQTAATWDDYVAAIRAFDRVMLHNYYWLPGSSFTSRAYARWDKFGVPEHGRLRRMAPVDIWWWDEEKAALVEAFTGAGK